MSAGHLEVRSLLLYDRNEHRSCGLIPTNNGTTVLAFRAKRVAGLDREGPLTSRSGFLAKSIFLLFAGVMVIVQVLLVAWATPAIYYSNLPWPWLRVLLAVTFAAFAIFAFFLSRRRWMGPAAVALFFGVVAWWISIPPSDDRPWRPEVAVMPRLQLKETAYVSAACAISSTGAETISPSL